jgi:RNA polymerase sigma factor (sigma-70 family)
MDERHPPHIDPVTEAVLLRGVAGGDERAFAGLVAAYADTVYSHCLAYVKSVEKAEELAQDVFVAIWAMRDRLASVENFSSYLFITTRNKVFRALRKRVRELVEVNAGAVETELLADLQTADLRAEYRDTYQLLLKGIGLLPEKRQQVFRMSRLDGMTHAQIARELGIHEITVAQYIVKSLSFLKKYMEEHGTDMILLIIVLRGLP